MITLRNESGLTLVEVLVSMVLLSILLIPAIQAIQTGVAGADVHADVASSHHRIASRLEELLTEPFADLSDAAIAAGSPTTASSYSEASGPPARLLVFLSLYDGDNADADDNVFTGTEPDLLWVRVEIENSVFSLETVKARGY
ncbi:MAG: type IV pilus modification PilV family protein [Woeseiaceae bacterium]